MQQTSHGAARRHWKGENDDQAKLSHMRIRLVGPGPVAGEPVIGLCEPAGLCEPPGRSRPDEADPHRRRLPQLPRQAPRPQPGRRLRQANPRHRRPVRLRRRRRLRVAQQVPMVLVRRQIRRTMRKGQDDPHAPRDHADATRQDRRPHGRQRHGQLPLQPAQLLTPGEHAEQGETPDHRRLQNTRASFATRDAARSSRKSPCRTGPSGWATSTTRSRRPAPTTARPSNGSASSPT
jgi:hypothetical protein